MSRPLLLATDLDRTLLPNGLEPESPGARARLAQVAALPVVTLVYVSGRDLSLVQEAIAAYHLPKPDFILADVGSSIYTRSGASWQRLERWDAHLAEVWAQDTPALLAALLAQFTALHLQASERQARYKLSYYTDLSTDISCLHRDIQAVMAQAGVLTQLIWSSDLAAGVHLLDILPIRADKYQALVFLAAQQGLARDDLLFAGDSGNDLPVLTSSIPAVLVRNAAPEVVQAARQDAPPATLYWANGGFEGMNGHYAAGILEGIAHYRPDIMKFLEAPGHV